MVVLMGAASSRWPALAVAAVIACGAAGHAQSPQRRVIHVAAERFAFTPSEIVVFAGEEIELRLKSDDTAHGFRITGTTVNVVIPKRGHDEIVVTFRAGEAGRYAFECTRMCGAGHHFMRGVLVVRNRATGPGGR
jgi:heme/copper-type cytochrome/quinol oxidase subunit 2